MAHRFRLGLELAVSGHRDLSAMVEHHSVMARRLGEDLGLGTDALAALDASYEQWDGKGWPGRLSGDAVPVAARLAMIGEYVEVAHRVGGVAAARAMLRTGEARSSTRTSPTPSMRTPSCCWPSWTPRTRGRR